MNQILQIGEKVSWQINGFQLVGAVMQDLENGFVETLIHTRDGMPYIQKVNTQKELLTKLN